MINNPLLTKKTILGAFTGVFLGLLIPFATFAYNWETDFDLNFDFPTNSFWYQYGNTTYTGTTTDAYYSSPVSLFLDGSGNGANDYISTDDVGEVSTTTFFKAKISGSTTAGFYSEQVYAGSLLGGLWVNFICPDITYWNNDISDCEYLADAPAVDTWFDYGWETKDNDIRYYFNGTWGNWVSQINERVGFNSFSLRTNGTSGIVYFDNFVSTQPTTTESYLIIDSPATGSTASTTFNLDFTYNFKGEDYDKILFLFEAWNASSTCPEWGSDTFYEEYENGWFYQQSSPYYSEILTATSTEATSTTIITDLPEGYTYNCNYCYFYKDATASSSLITKCPDYILTIQGQKPASQPVPITRWENYYTAHTDPKFPTSTAIFTGLSEKLDTITQNLSSFINNFRSLFDNTKAFNQGKEYGEVVPMARGYLASINSFFGDLPVSEMFIFFILTAIVVVLYRIIARILHLIRG